MTRLAVLSLHSSPLLQPGVGDSGGMNVYVRELTASLAQTGVDTTVFVRRWADDLPDEVQVEPGFRVVHLDAGEPDLPKELLPSILDRFTDELITRLEADPVDLIHANYWLSGMVGHTAKHELDLPLVSTFHTLARVKAEHGDPEPFARIDAEDRIIGCSDLVLANSVEERAQLMRLHRMSPSRIEIVPPGVQHAFFAPGDRRGARTALGLDAERPMLLFVGRIQPLKGLDVAVGALAGSRHRNAELVVVGGPSGVDGHAELNRVLALADTLGVRDRIRLVEPQPHHLLTTWYRAADVVLVPSRSESFGLVALEAAACGIPVVASAVGGLRTLVRPGRTGLLVADRQPSSFAAAVDQILDDPDRAAHMGQAAASAAGSYTWAGAAARLDGMYRELTVREPVDCLAA